MLVKDRMTSDPLITATPEMPVTEAQTLMHEHNVRHLPVVETVAPEGGRRLVGLLTRETMMQAVPWSSASLSALETQYVLSKVTAGKVMITDVVTTSEDTAVEEAARIMVDHKIGCLPVVRDGALIGIITDIDLLATTMEMLGARRPGIRVAVLVPYRPGEIARLSAAIADIDGNVTAFGTWEGEENPATGAPEQFGMVFRVESVSREQLLTAIEKLEDIELLDVRQILT